VISIPIESLGRKGGNKLWYMVLLLLSNCVTTVSDEGIFHEGT
jgi:hypothetical protein